jgi:ankyrin repeat protein
MKLIYLFFLFLLSHSLYPYDREPVPDDETPEEYSVNQLSTENVRKKSPTHDEVLTSLYNENLNYYGFYSLMKDAQETDSDRSESSDDNSEGSEDFFHNTASEIMLELINALKTSNHEALLDFLDHAHFDPSYKDQYGNNIMHYVGALAHGLMLDFMASYEKIIHLKASTNNDMYTPSDVARYYGNDYAQRILKTSSSISVYDQLPPHMFSYTLIGDFCNSQNKPLYTSYTPQQRRIYFDDACKALKDDKESLYYVLVSRLDMTYQDKRGNTIMHHAAASHKKYAVLALCARKDMSHVLSMKNVEGETPYTYGQKHNALENVSILYRYMSDIQSAKNIYNQKNNRDYQESIDEDHSDSSSEEESESDTSSESSSESGYVSRGYLSLMNLITAIKEHDYKMFVALYKYIHASWLSDTYSNTLAHYICAYGTKEMLNHILHPGSEYIYKKVSQSRYTPYMIARYYKNDDIIDLLKDKHMHFYTKKHSQKPLLQW